MKSLFIIFVALLVVTQVFARKRINDHVNDILCDTCTELITELDALLKVDQDQVVSTLSSLCDDLRLPGNLSAECKEYVKEYVPLIFEIIESEDPKELCAEMSLCSEADVKATTPAILSEKNRSSLRNFKGIDKFIVSVKEQVQQNVVQAMVKKMLSDDVVCEGCKQTVQFIHDLLANNQTQADIVEALEMVCAYLPQEFQEECREYIELIPEVMTTIADTYFMPDEDCEAVGLCPGEVEVIVPEIPDMPELPESPEVELPVAVQNIFPGFDSILKPNKHKKKLSQKTRLIKKPKRFLRAIPKMKVKNKTKKLEKQLPNLPIPKVTKYDKVAAVEEIDAVLITDTAVTKSANETVGCKLCVHFVETFAKFINKYKAQVADAIIENVTTFCDRLPPPYSTKCTDEVSPYMKKYEIEIAITLYLTPEEICPLVIENCP
ncbi:prosaposin-like [Anneissia japonica]|uniref:prosaposin-like n=1 Tax=Anneissia japonica TaxID=1529436 RepID=UPI0014256A98|nr:prosaposin-like [Anneissia japonica]